ncbi:amidohydrolase [Marinoscillum sp.]|uniref:amidohydrolase n=1 Tax=Marinoscillum sp. TaxID=2024838 RepID=UPI003BA90B96
MSAELKIALIQSDLHWENIDANLAMFEEKIWTIRESVDLIVLPEMFTTGFSMNPQNLAEVHNTKTFKWMQQQAAQTKAVIMGSMIVKEGTSYYNRFYAVYPDGTFKKYDKKHRFGLAGEDKDYTAGEERVILEVNGWKIFPLVCYDLRFPVWARSRKQPDSLYEYDLLIYVANWPEPRVNAWDTLLAARAIENTAYCVGVNRVGEDGVGANYVGHSAVYDYKGNAMAFSEKEEILTATITKDDLVSFRERFPFQADADEFELS